MLMLNWRGWRSALSFSALFLVLSCTNSTNSKKETVLGRLNPAPTEKLESQENRLKRYLNQTSFLNYVWEPVGLERAATMEKNAPGGGAREIQESDIYKIGKEGSKLLYLLNNSRGLQKISFENGVEKPALVGRVAPSGNYPDDMYYDKARDQILVLENPWFTSDGANTNRNARLLIYDTSDKGAPVLKKEITMAGEISDSRMAGDVLYVATSEWPSNWWDENQSAKATGHVFSYSLEKGDAKEIEHLDLSQPVSARENMNLVQVGEKYYIMAVLSDSRWGWGNQRSTVEVLDITDPKGKIKPVLLATTRGLIEERSGTLIKNDTLIVTNQYTPEGEGAVGRIGVETFTFPVEGSKKISPRNAKLRQLYVEDQLAQENNPAKKEELRAKLLSDPQWGLKGVFVELEGKRLQKLAPDAQANSGATQTNPRTGRPFAADLQDVRVAGDKLYAFWRPVDTTTDPLDVFDISKPEVSVAHIGHLEFDGWLEKSIPLRWKDKDFVMGLGHVVPAGNNERGLQYPQAMLIEIKTSQPSGKVKFDVVAQMSFETSNTWVNLNSPDKYFEIKDKGDGTGSVMFQIESWGTERSSGAKLIGYDLNKAVEGRDDVFVEGRVMVGKAAWLRRVFTNPEIDAINAFSDKQLTTYPVTGLGAVGEVAKAISVLELARNIESYVSVGGKGIQIVNATEGYYWQDIDGKTELRVVAPEKADSEVSQLLSLPTTLPGYYSDHFVTSDGKLLVLTVQEKSIAPKEGEGPEKWQSFANYELSRVVIDGNSAKVEANAKWSVNRREEGNPLRFSEAKFNQYSWYYGLGQFVRSGDNVILNLGTGIRLITGKNGIAAEPIETKDCVSAEKLGVKPEMLTQMSLQVISGSLYASYTIREEDELKREGVGFEANYLAPAKLDSTALTCGVGMSIPGRAVAVLRDGKQVVTVDTRLKDLLVQKTKYTNSEGKEVEEVNYRPFTETGLVALETSKVEREGKQVDVLSLKDLHDAKGVNLDSIKQIGKTEFVYFNSVEEEMPMWRRGRMLMHGGFFPRMRVRTSTELVRLSLDEATTRFTESYTALDLKVGNPTLAQVFVLADRTVGLVVGGNSAQVISWTAASPRPETRKVSVVDPSGNKGEPVEKFPVLNPWSFLSGYGQRDAAHYSEALKSLELTEGEHGITQVFLVD